MSTEIQRAPAVPAEVGLDNADSKIRRAVNQGIFFAAGGAVLGGSIGGPIGGTIGAIAMAITGSAIGVLGHRNEPR